MAGPTAVAAHLPAAVGDALLAAGRAAFTDGLHLVAAISAALLAAVAVLVLATLRHIEPFGDAGQPEEEALAGDPHFLAGLNVHRGRITHAAAAESLGYEVLPARTALAA